MVFLTEKFNVLLREDVVVLLEDGSTFPEATTLLAGSVVEVSQKGWEISFRIIRMASAKAMRAKPGAVKSQPPVEWTGEPPLPNGAPL